MRRIALMLTVLAVIINPVASTQAATGSWSMAGCTPDRRHYSNAGLTPPLKFAWDTNKQGSVYAIPPLISGNFCYLGMAKMPVGNSWETSVQKRNLEDGDIAWDLPGGWWIWSIYGADLIVQGYSAKEGKSWLRRINSMDRSTIWEIEWPRYTIHSVLEDDVIYSMSYTDWKENEDQKDISERIFVFQANSAENGRMLWRKMYSYPNAYYPPWLCVWDNGVYGGVSKTIYKLNKESGAEIWKVNMPEKIGQGSYFVGTDKGVLCNTIYDNLKLIKHEDGSVIWTKKLSSYVPDSEDCQSPVSTSAIMAGKIYIVSRGSFTNHETKKLLCLDLATSRTIWEITLPDTSRIEHSDIGTTCTATAGAIYTMTEDASGRLTKLRAFDPESGVLLWSDVMPGQPNPSELVVNSEFLVMGLEARDENGKGIMSYVCLTNKGVPKPKLEVDQSDFDFGYINSKEQVNKIVKISNSGSGELMGTATANVSWIVCTPSQFQGNNQSIVVSIKPDSLKIGTNTGFVTISSSGGKKTINVTVTYGGGVEPKVTNEAESISCKDASTWSKQIDLKGFHHGIVTASVPWLMVSPMVFETTDPSILVSINPMGLHNTSVFVGKVTVMTNLVSYTFTVTVNGVTPDISMLMQINNTSATINGQTFKVDPPPQIIKGSTFVPLRFIGDAFGVTMNYDAKTKKITYKTQKGDTVTLQIDSTKAFIGSREVKISPPPAIVKGKTLVPVRFIGESFGANVVYTSSTKTISIEMKGCP